MHKIFFLFFTTHIFFLYGIETYGSLDVTKVLRVHDGDTFIADIDGVHPIIGKGVSIRLYGIDAPEITSHNPKIKALAIAARDFLADKLNKANQIRLVHIRRDKYFRILAEVFIDGEEIGPELVYEGLAKFYDGGTKTEWK